MLSGLKSATEHAQHEQKIFCLACEITYTPCCNLPGECWYKLTFVNHQRLNSCTIVLVSLNWIPEAASIPLSLKVFLLLISYNLACVLAPRLGTLEFLNNLA